MYLIGTDGACKGNPGPGTWAFVVFKDTHVPEMVGHKKGHKAETTNNEMELTAIVECLRWANKHKLKVEIMTDSAYCLNGITKWLEGWKARGWKTAKGSPIANQELWNMLDVLYDPSKHKFTKVKGHSGDPINEAADMYCNEEYLNTFI